jgi:hypothetical protein
MKRNMNPYTIIGCINYILYRVIGLCDHQYKFKSASDKMQQIRKKSYSIGPEPFLDGSIDYLVLEEYIEETYMCEKCDKKYIRNKIISRTVIDKL